MSKTVRVINIRAASAIRNVRTIKFSGLLVFQGACGLSGLKVMQVKDKDT